MAGRQNLLVLPTSASHVQVTRGRVAFIPGAGTVTRRPDARLYKAVAESDTFRRGDGGMT